MGVIENFKLLTGEQNDDLSRVICDMARQVVVRKCYPFGTGCELVPEKYEHKQLEIAVFIYNKRGAEGETSHSENGINRSYETASIPLSMTKDIIPFIKPVGDDNALPCT